MPCAGFPDGLTVTGRSRSVDPGVIQAGTLSPTAATPPPPAPRPCSYPGEQRGAEPGLAWLSRCPMSVLPRKPVPHQSSQHVPPTGFGLFSSHETAPPAPPPHRLLHSSSACSSDVEIFKCVQERTISDGSQDTHHPPPHRLSHYCVFIG